MRKSSSPLEKFCEVVSTPESLFLEPGQRLLSCSLVGIISVQCCIVSDKEIIGRAGSRRLVGGVIALPYWELGCGSI